MGRMLSLLLIRRRAGPELTQSAITGRLIAAIDLTASRLPSERRLVSPACIQVIASPSWHFRIWSDSMECGTRGRRLLITYACTGRSRAGALGRSETSTHPASG